MKAFTQLLIIFSLFCFSLPAQVPPARYVILISVDGFRPEFYKDPQWAMPTLQQMAHGGVYADGVRSVFPSVTYPSHTTMLTGALPSRHGIYYNSPFSKEGENGKWYWETGLIKVPTIWDAARKAGLKTASIHWPVSLGAPVDYNIPEVWATDKNVERTLPMRQQATPKGLMEEMEQKATGKLTANDLNSDFLVLDQNIARMASYLIQTYKPNLTTVHLLCVDHFAHEEGRQGPKVRKAVAAADMAISQIMEALERAGIKDSTAIIVTGDHGFVDVHTILAPNVWLAQKGLLESGSGRGNWKAAFHTSGAAAFLYLKDKNDTKTVKQVQDMLQALPASQKKLFRIVNRAELEQIGADPEVVLALAPVPGVNMSSSAQGEALRSGKGGTHGFFPDFEQIQTGFVGYGAGFAKEKRVPVMGLEDIAPLITTLLGIPFQSPDGVLYPGLVELPKKSSPGLSGK
jgi:predicted AlkP superfamily pyrophosphatase or phosphodiesterase